MYCIKCGVELSAGQKICPICQTKVYHPDLPMEEAKPTYPQKEFQSEEFNPKGVLFVITILAALVIALIMGFEISWHREVNWSGYVAGGILLAYLIAVLPSWFKHPNPVIFVPCDFVGALIYLFYINLQCGGEWFFSFALQITSALGLIVSAMVALMRYLRRGRLYVVGGGLIAVGAWTVLLEALLRTAFAVKTVIYWSPFSCATLFTMGMMLIIIAIVKPLRESLRKIFFVGKVS